jgi:hypothetical protein
MKRVYILLVVVSLIIVLANFPSDNSLSESTTSDMIGAAHWPTPPGFQTPIPEYLPTPVPNLGQG